ncbi:MAG: hypothetical protein PV344_06190 [Anaplasma sp.]|nr:hypothetical protein [Anaplasma sp.]
MVYRVMTSQPHDLAREFQTHNAPTITHNVARDCWCARHCA